MPNSPQTRLQNLLFDFDGQIPLDQAMICVAEDEDPEAGNIDILSMLDQIASDISLPNTENIFDSISRINFHLFTILGFSGEWQDYYHPHNSLIHKVLERKVGLPILLSSLYIEVARRLDIQILGIGFPNHFIIQPVLPSEKAFFIDPFRKGEILCEEDLQALLLQYHHHLPLKEAIQPISNRKIIQRINSNLFFSHKRRNSGTGMLRTLERLILISPECSDLFRIRSCLLAQLGEIEKAIFSLEFYMEQNPNAEDISECEQRLKQLKTPLQSKSVRCFLPK